MTGIIPKPIKKASRLFEFSTYIVFGLVLAAVVAYVALFYIGNKTSAALQDLQEKVAQVGTSGEKNLETQVLFSKKKIDDFAKIFADHQRASFVFKFLEENCHPKIWFDKVELNIHDYQAVMSGETSSFETLGQQIIIFKNHKMVESVELSDFAIGKNGRVNFTFSISLKPEIFQNNE
ncbi:MAG: hypothetical protein ABH841_01690 [Candidatus Nealsonbacteria bacterium]